MSRTRAILTVAAVLWLTHGVVTATLGTRGSGPLLSDLIQFLLGGVLIFTLLDASDRSEGMARAFWRLAVAA